MDKIKQELKTMTSEQLVSKVSELRQELFALRLKDASEPVANYMQFKSLKRAIAQGLTYINQNQQFKTENKV